jgi:hypothetical protein
VSGYINDGNPDNEKYIGVHVSVHSNTNLQTALWRKPIYHNSSNKEIYHWRRCMHVYDGKVYLSGYLEDTNKTKTSAGTHWASPFLYCYNVSNGSQVFKKTYPKSTSSDKFYDIADHNGSILVSGISSQSYCSTCSKEFTVGNAWMNRINAQTGELMSQKTFGNPTHSTWISQFCITNNSLWGVGYLNYTNQSGLGWIVKINPDNI